jgi:outer membrane biosynthesis protein TonB
MSNSNQNKPGGKPGQRGRKPEQQRSPKPEQQLSPKAEQLQSQKPVQQPSPKPEQLQSPKPEQQPSLKPEQQPSLKPAQQLSQKPEPQLSQKPEPQPSPKPVQQQDGNKQFDAALAPANTLSVDFQTIATAYSDYTKKSFEETKAFVEKLSGVRSLDKAIEIQTEFAKQAYETFVTESQKIRELYSGLAKQSFKPFEGLVAKTTQTAR